MANFVIIPDKPGQFTKILSGSLHYKFNAKYETLPNPDTKLSELTLVITSGNKYFVGLKYAPSLEAPVITMKGTGVATIKKYCAENYVQIVNNKCLAARLYECEKDNHIPPECYEEVADILAKFYDIINDISTLYVYKDKMAVGVKIDINENNKYRFQIVFKAKNQLQTIINMCKEKKVFLEYDKKATEILFNDYKMNDIIKEE
jgi:type III secretion system FlhB-like substrate exporter